MKIKILSRIVNDAISTTPELARHSIIPHYISSLLTNLCPGVPFLPASLRPVLLAPCVVRSSQAPPAPPPRDPRTTLSVGRARAKSMVAGLQDIGKRMMLDCFLGHSEKVNVFVIVC